jgi:hypothetical protein
MYGFRPVGAAGIEVEDFCPRIFTDGHGLMGEGFPVDCDMVLGFCGVGLSGKKRKNAVPADWERIFTDGKIVGCGQWGGP